LDYDLSFAPGLVERRSGLPRNADATDARLMKLNRRLQRNWAMPRRGVWFP
jgi:hypothetical protein